MSLLSILFEILFLFKKMQSLKKEKEIRMKLGSLFIKKVIN